MKPIPFREQTCVLTGWDNIEPLPAARTESTVGVPVVVYKWYGSWKDRLRFVLTGVMWLTVMGESPPPMEVHIENPYRVRAEGGE